ncbi:hypothetical protein BH11VER1_BH11VER1_16530 [soil metagenome]
MWCSRTSGTAVLYLMMTVFLNGGLQAQEAPVPPPVVTPPSAVVSVVVIDGKTMAGDFLNILGQQTKALWRKLYRDPPPTPSTDRLKVAFTLGVLIADSHLKLQAGDAQKFRDNNQDLLAYCKVLGLSEKITPEVMAEGKMAETEDWNGLKEKVNGLRQLIMQLLKDQRDEDLSILVNLGVWMRLQEISSSLVLNDPEITHKTLCIGSPLLINDMIADFEKLTEVTRLDPLIAQLGKTLQHLQRYWSDVQEPVSMDQVQMSSDKIKHIVSKIAQ